MATLSADVQARYSAQILIEASNPQNSGQTTLDSTRFDNAVTDVQAWFEVKVGTEYDSTVDTHVAVAVEGVVLRLQVLTGQAPVERWEEWKTSELWALAQVTGRDRIKPQSDSLLTNTQDTAGDLVAFDRKNFTGYLPNGPNNSTTNND